MESKLTKGIKISVEPEFQEDLSNPRKQKFVYTYKVRITNKSEHSIQLLARKWTIFDSSGVKRKVEGKGVVGKQPRLAPGESFSYESWCPLISEIGYMEGIYVVRREADQSEMEVKIPRFLLIANFLKN